MLRPFIYYTNLITLDFWLSIFLCSQGSPFFEEFDIDLDKSGILGDGSYSVCRKCVEKSSGQEYAVKIISRKIDCSDEINLLRACQGHPNIVNLHYVFQDEVSATTYDNLREAWVS